MRETRFSGKEPQQVMLGLITDPIVCSRITAIWDGSRSFENDDYQLVAGWCVDYFRKYNRPIDKQMRVIFNQWSGKEGVSEDRARNVERLMVQLSEMSRRREVQTDLLLNIAQDYFNRIRLELEWEQANYDARRGNVEKAMQRMQGFTEIKLIDDDTIKPAEDFEPWRKAFEKSREKPLFTYPEGLNDFLGYAMVRDGFVAFMAPDKSLKSIWLLDAVFRSIMDRRRVVLFEAGDLSQDQVMMRMAARASGRPRYAGEWRVPIALDASLEPATRMRSSDSDLRTGEAYRAFQRLCRGNDRFRLRVHSNGTLTTASIEGYLRAWKREGWSPDVVVIDYADILAPPVFIKDPLDQIDENWKHLRRISQNYECLVLTATQSNAAAYSKKTPTLNRSHFSGRKTKLAHVTGMIGINLTEVWKERNVCGLNWVVQRDGTWPGDKLVMVAGCYAIMNPVIVVSRNEGERY